MSDAVAAGAPLKKKQRIVGARDPLKGGFPKAGKRGEGKMTEAELAASRIKVKVSPRRCPRCVVAPNASANLLECTIVS